MTKDTSEGSFRKNISTTWQVIRFSQGSFLWFLRYFYPPSNGVPPYRTFIHFWREGAGGGVCGATNRNLPWIFGIHIKGPPPPPPPIHKMWIICQFFWTLPLVVPSDGLFWADYLAIQGEEEASSSRLSQTEPPPIVTTSRFLLCTWNQHLLRERIMAEVCLDIPGFWQSHCPAGGHPCQTAP